MHAPEPEQLDLENNPDHVRRANEFVRTLDDAELSQGIVCPRAFIGRLRGYGTNHIGTKGQWVIVRLAEDEQWRRRDVEVRQAARQANRIAALALMFSAVSALGTVAAAIFAVVSHS